MPKRPIETVEFFIVMTALRAELTQHRAHVYIFYTEAHKRLASKQDGFENAIAQAERVFSGDPQCGSPCIGQKELLAGLAQLAHEKHVKIALLCGPVKVARDMAVQLEKDHPGFRGLIAIDLPPSYDTNETITGQVIASINQSGADIVLISSLLRNQEVWLANYRHRCNCSIMIGLH